VELLLVLEAGGEGAGDGRQPGVDVAVGLAVTTTVAELQEALVGFARREGLLTGTASTALGLHLEGDHTPLPPASPVVECGVVDGDALVLRPVGSRSGWWGFDGGPAAGDRLVLDVIGGPDSGRSVALEPGALSVGRSPRCRLAVEDPTLSRRHFSLQVADRWAGGLDVTLVPDAAARNGVVVEGRLVEEPWPLEVGEPLRAGDSLFVLRELPPDADDDAYDNLDDAYEDALDEPDGAAEVPPPAGGPRRRNLGGVRSAPLPPAGGLGGGRRFAHQRQAFYERVEEMAARVDQALRDERAERHAAAPDLAALARTPGGKPRTEAGGPLVVRVGLGEVASLVTVGVAPGGVVELRRQALERLAHHRVARDVPMAVDLDEAGVLGVCGPAGQVLGAVGAVVLQAACRHGPDELVVAAAIGETHLDRFEWMKWLPHLRAGRRTFAATPAAAQELVEEMLDLVAARLGGRDRAHPRALLVLDHEAEVPRWLLDRLLAVAADHGIRVVWFGDAEPLVPDRCGACLWRKRNPTPAGRSRSVASGCATRRELNSFRLAGRVRHRRLQ
jgi:S-DNA-T family DNA segregation ATPase FtsK/SpoIIIE